MSSNEISFNTDLQESIRTRADFTYNITPTMISITDTGLGKCSVTEDIEAVLRKIEHWHQGSIAKFKIMCRDGKGFWHRIHWDGKTASFFALEETDEQKACRRAAQAMSSKNLQASRTHALRRFEISKYGAAQRSGSEKSHGRMASRFTTSQSHRGNSQAC
jgi:hypothetical protein